MSGPLAGKTVVITRALGQSASLAAKLAEWGAEVLELPTIEFQPPEDYAPMDAAIARLASYDWAIFTSVNGARFFFERLERSGADPNSLRARLCAIGPATARALEERGLRVELMPQEYVAESLVAAFAAHDLAGRRILLPRAAVARDVVPEELTRRGAQVDVVEAYRTGIPAETARRAGEIFSAPRKPDWVTFTSSSTVSNFVAAAGVKALAGVRVASIGPVTSATARRHGIEITVEAKPFTVDGLVAAILGC